jgi:hypothetical protein
MPYSACMVRYHGVIYRVPKASFDTEERAQDRAWYIACKIKSWPNGKPDQVEYEALLNESHIYANKKYFGMEY